VGILTVSNNNSGTSTLQLDGSAGSVNANPVIMYWAGRNNATPTIENVVGNNSFAPDSVFWVGGGGTYRIQSDAGTLTVSGTIPGVAPSGYRSLVFGGSGNILMTGTVVDGDGGANNCTNSLIKTGSGLLTLTGTNRNTGTNYLDAGILLVDGSTGTNTLTVAGGQLGGTGTIHGPTIIGADGTLAPGDQAVGTLTISNQLALAGTTIMEINKTAGTSDRVTGLAGVCYGGTLVISNLSGTLMAGDTFGLFSTAAGSGNFANIIGQPNGPSGSQLAYDFNPTNGVLSVVALPLPPPSIVFDGSDVTVAWTNPGMRLYAQTNPMTVGLSTNWVYVAGSESITNVVFPVNQSNITVFYRLGVP